MASYHDESSGASGSSAHLAQRCDGVKPVCGPCSQSTTGRWEVCDFVPYSRTEARVLKEQIETLEAHIEELQLSKSSNPESSVTHHRRSSSQSTSLPPASARVTRASDTSSTHARQRAWLSAFFERAHDLHFFLDIPRFRASFQSRASPPSPALLDAIYLWGAHCSSELSNQASLISRARQSARLLLGQYFYGLDKSVEAGYYLNGAWSLALAADLHRQRDVDQTRIEIHGGSGSLNYLAKASVIFERCTSVRTAAASGESSDEGLASQIHALDDVIAPPSDAGPLRAALFTHTTLRAAVIQLHAPMADVAVRAARAVARMAGDVGVGRLGHVSPVMAVVGSSSGLTILRGVIGRQTCVSAWARSPVLEEALGTFAPRCSLYESRLLTIRQVRAAVGI
ncbi:hypothetical protein BD626DRAFT_547650 [Schizophyllum amplum]|uniref:Transcription factor domain-containing protein n=1 Tax=Schizophyllum amplum TaxID=97359 RepID=A0A550CG40_9AGAR|nr:hypothetical protein BD626DRAFT_547650 [Auriculariopsis ampla]